MKARGIFQLAIGAALVASTVSAQAVVFGDGLNDIEIINRENVYRTAASCEANGGCLLNSELIVNGAGTGLFLTDPSVANNIYVGDKFIGAFASRTVTNYGTTVWGEDNVQSGGIDTFTGYFVQDVKEIQLNIDGGDTDRVILGTGTDPFGILGAGEVARAFVDNASLANTAYSLDGLGLTLLQSIQSLTDGALWAALTIGDTVLGTAVDNDGYLMTEADLAVAGNNGFNGSFFTAWMLGLLGPAYNAGTLTGINDPDELVKGGAQLGDPLTTSTQNALGLCTAVTDAYACNDIVGNGQLTFNQNASFSPWLFASEDPLQLYRAVPEPGSLALMGAALLGMVAAGRRRRS